MPPKPAIETDALIIGGGPAGLFQAFQLGLQGIACHLVDALPHLGGQCAQLYPDKPIYDIPALAACSGRELVQRLCAQIAPLGVPAHLAQQVTHLARGDGGRWHLTTTAGQRFQARSVFIAAGVGAFVPKALKVPGAQHLVPGGQLHYHPGALDMVRGQTALVYGGDAAAVDAAVHAAALAQTTWLLHRRDVFQAEAALLEQLHTLRGRGRIRVLTGQITQLHVHGGQLHGVHWMDGAGAEHALPVQHLIVCQGISPQLGPLATWPLTMERKHLCVNPGTQATAQPGIYAVGDIVHYPGKRKLIVCAFHEATLAAFAAFEYLRGTKPVLQYTTASAKVHAMLGVA